MIARVVIGANFGDEGKGLVTDWLCSQGAGVVVRFNGGANAGHTVVTPDGERHVFSHFGSGTLCGIPTFLSQFFVCNPIQFFEERQKLITLGFHPEVFAHPDCLVTTFADMMINQAKEEKRGRKRHGSCGVGFHETQVRSQVDHLKITMSDLWNGGRRLEEQLEEISDKYAKFRCGFSFKNAAAIRTFIAMCEQFAELVNPAGIGQCKDPVFEASQGLQLDQHNKRFHPHLTHSNTGMRNVEKLCAQAGIDRKEIYYVSRTYLTRHGAGTLPGEDPRMSYPDDTNLDHAFQGSLRFAPLDTNDLFDRIREDAGSNAYKLVLTHCDQRPAPCSADLYASGVTRLHVEENKSAIISAGT